MKYFLMFLAFFVGSAYAETVINYDDGSTYTLEDGQEIYIASEASTLFTRKLMNNKNTLFYAQKPWSTRDYVPAEDGIRDGGRVTRMVRSLCAVARRLHV